MTRLFYCNTNYNAKPPVDINPLILQRYRSAHILVLCARDGMVKRIAKMTSEDSYPYPHQHVLAYGWWEAEEMGLVVNGQIDSKELLSYEVIVIIGKDRVPPKLSYLVDQVEQIIRCSSFHQTK